MTVQELKSLFQTIYGTAAKAIYFSPGRVNLLGEHVDYNGGTVLPFALELGTYLLIAENTCNKIQFKSLNFPDEASVNIGRLKPRLSKSWINNPLAVIAHLKQRGYELETGYDLLFWANVPRGAGLSSSASLEVVTVLAFSDLVENKQGESHAINIGRLFERNFPFSNCSIIDQLVLALGIEGHGMCLNCDTLVYEHIPINLKGIKIVISKSNNTRTDITSLCNRRALECKLAISQLRKVYPVENLADLCIDEFIELEYAITDPVALKRARHVVSEEQRTKLAVEAIRHGDYTLFGKLMNASHISLRDDYEVTGEELDTLVEISWKMPGVVGSRMTGLGSGGCTVSLVREEFMGSFVLGVGEQYRSKFGRLPDFIITEIGAGARRVF